MILFVLLLMTVMPAIVYGLHALLVLVTKHGTYRLFYWPDYAVIPVAFAAWIVLEVVFSAKSLTNLVLEPMYASMGWSALILIRSLVNVIMQRKPTRVVCVRRLVDRGDGTSVCLHAVYARMT